MRSPLNAVLEDGGEIGRHPKENPGSKGSNIQGSIEGRNTSHEV